MLGHIGNCHKRLGDRDRALEFHNRALALKRETGDRLEEGKTLSHIGLVYWEQSEYQAAIEHYTKAAAIAAELGDRQLEGAVLNNLSMVHDELGDYRRSLPGYRRALELFRALGADQHISFTLGNIGGVHLLLGQYRDALGYYQQALAISERLKQKASISQDLGNIALCQIGLGQINEALATFDRALKLAEEAGLKKEEADWQKGKGTALLRSGRYDLARRQYDIALKIYEQGGLKRELSEALEGSGNLYLLLGDLASSEREFRRAADLAAGIGHARGVTSSLLALGDLELRRQRQEEAAALYARAFERAEQARDRERMSGALLRRAAAARVRGDHAAAEREAERALAIARAAATRLLEAEALYTLGEAARALGRLDAALARLDEAEAIAQAAGDPDLGWRIGYSRGQALEAQQKDEEAIAAYRRAVTAIEGVRNQLREDRFRAGYIEDKYQVYVALVRLLLRAGRAGEAFGFAERLRARAYLDLLNRGVPPIRDEAQRQAEIELRERIRRLQEAITTATEKPAPYQRNQAVAVFSSELAAAERAYEELLDKLRASDPGYAAARSLRIPSTADVQGALEKGTALVEYIVGDTAISAFVLAPGLLEATVVPLSGVDLRSKVELFRELVVPRGSGPAATAWVKPAESLRQALIEPLERAGWLKDVRRLYVVPHGILHYLPFAALPRTGNDRLRFLAEDYEVAYLPAAAALVHPPSQAAGQGRLLAVAPARAGLPYAVQEARAIGAYFPRPGTLLLGERATESAFKRAAGEHGTLHLATHGYFNKLNPLFSGVQLEPDEREDGRLDVHEILGLRLKASLVTLSACETALAAGVFSDVPAGDDFVGLTRAFLFAGSPSVLASLWEVNDRSTMQLMRRFYKELKTGGKSAALARTQRAVLSAPGRYRHPYYWAAFVLVGQME